MTDSPPPSVREIFDAVVDLPPEERASQLDRLCGGDARLRRQVESLLAVDGADDGTIERVVQRTASHLAPAPLRVGTELGPYRILGAIGEGGMGSVYLAERSDRAFDLQVAIKVVRGGLDSPRLVERFLEERRILAALDHPNIARVLDGGTTEDGLPFLVMEYVDGQTIDRYCAQHGLSIRKRVDLVRRVCAAVEHAHQQLIVHRDLKPANVLVTGDGQPKLLDFGIAKLLEANRERSLTQTQARPMTPEYASPEQVRGEPITTATDVHAVGLLLYLLLTGQHPFLAPSSTQRELEAAVLERDPESPSTAVTRNPTGAGGTPPPVGSPAARRRELRGDLDNIVLKALAKEPERRYSSIGELSADLGRYLDGHTVLARPATFGYQAGKFLRRNAAPVAVGVLLFGTVLTASIVSTRAYLRADRLRVEAENQRDRLEQVNGFLASIFEAASPEKRQSSEEATARELLDAGAANVEAELADQPEIAATIESEIARRYQDLGLLDQAEALSAKAVTRLREIDALDSREGVTALIYYGQALAKTDRLEEAREIYTEARSVADGLGPAHFDAFVEASKGLSEVLVEFGDLEAAEAIVRHAIEGLREEPYASDPEYRGRLASTQSNLALLLQRQGRTEDAIPWLQSSIAIASKLHGPHHTVVGEFYSNLAFLQNRVGRREEGVVSARRALEVQLSILGDEHVEVANARLNLADALAGLGAVEEADELYPVVLETFRQVFGERHHRIGTVHNNAALAMLNHGRADLALPRLEQAAAIYSDAFGPEHQYTLIARHNHARALNENDQADEAERACRANLALRRRTLGEHPDVVRSHSLLSAILRRQERSVDAEAAAREGVEFARSFLSPADGVRIGCERQWARTLTDLERREEAIDVLRAAHAVCDELRGADDRLTEMVAEELAELEG